MILEKKTTGKSCCRLHLVSQQWWSYLFDIVWQLGPANVVPYLVLNLGVHWSAFLTLVSSYRNRSGKLFSALKLSSLSSLSSCCVQVLHICSNESWAGPGIFAIAIHNNQRCVISLVGFSIFIVYMTELNESYFMSFANWHGSMHANTACGLERAESFDFRLKMSKRKEKRQIKLVQDDISRFMEFYWQSQTTSAILSSKLFKKIKILFVSLIKLDY